MFSSRPSNAYDANVEKATSESLTSEPWDLMLTICDKVNLEGEAGARNVVQAIQKRFVHRNANVQLYALTLTDTLVSNCQQLLHREVASNTFTESLKRLALDRTSHDRVKKRAAALVKKWSGEFESDTRLGLMNDAYELLRNKGAVFEDEQPSGASTSGSAAANESRENELARREEEDMQRAIRESELEAERSQSRFGGGYAPPSALPPQHHQPAAQSPAPAPSLPGGFPAASTSDANKPLPSVSPGPAQIHSTPAPAAPVPQQPQIMRAQALYDFEPDPSQPGELPLRKGDIVRVLERAYAEWWRGECRGRVGIFPVNWVQVLPEPTAEQLAQEAQVEASVFAQLGSVDQLLDLLRAAEERGESGHVGDDEQVTQLYQQCLALRPKILKLIEKHTQKKNELLDINARFVQAKRGYESMLEESWAQHSSAQQQPQPGYAPQQPQVIAYANHAAPQSNFYQPYGQPAAPALMDQQQPAAYGQQGSGAAPQQQQQQLLPMPGQPDYYSDPAQHVASPNPQQQPQQQYYQQPSMPQASGPSEYAPSPQPQQGAPQVAMPGGEPLAQQPYPSGYPGEAPMSTAPQPQHFQQ